MIQQAHALTKKDFMSDQTVRWCPGCGDYAILSQVQTVMAESGIPKEQFAVVSGIGCSSRFPYYLSTYGYHTIHGRAPAVATGLKIANPDLNVWVITGDGDALSIGGNHLIHVLRRNVDMQILLFNNRLYGLTKGQYSPTSEAGKLTKSSPMGSIEHPFIPCATALGADATFVARTVDIFVKEQREVLRAAVAHKGAAFVEILQNCVIFNDGAWKDLTERKLRDEHVIFVEHGQPMIFGPKNGPKKGLRLDQCTTLEVVELSENPTLAEMVAKQILVHDETNAVLANMLARMQPPFPVAMGVLYRVEKSTYEREAHAQVARAKERPGAADLQAVLHGRETWTVE